MTGTLAPAGMTGQFVTTAMTGHIHSQYVLIANTGHIHSQYALRSETGQFITTALTGVLVPVGITGNAFYPRFGNPSNFLTSISTFGVTSINVSGISLSGGLIFTGINGQTIIRSGQTIVFSGANTGGLVSISQTGQFITTAMTGQYAPAGMTGQFVTTALTGVLVSAGITGNAFYPRYGNPAGYLTSATQSSQSPWTGNIAASAHNLSGVNTGLFNKVGILNNNPAFPLDVIGNINLNGDLYVNANRTLIASGNSIVLGQNSPTAGVGLGTYSVNIGYAANCAGTDSISIGCTNVTNGSRAVGITRDGGAWNDGSIAIGYQANAGATDAIAIGRNSTCDGVDSIVMGIGVITDITSVFILGNGQKVGINHYEPTYQLDVSGNGRFSDGLSAN
jgi:hypothetical protein